MPRLIPGNKVADTLCLKCGICCDGTLFKGVELQPADDFEQLCSLGLSLKQATRRQTKAEAAKFRFPQPCAALCADGHCQIYADRPAHCRDFECALFKAVAAGRIGQPAALRIIRAARQRADRVRQLLSALGDEDKHIALTVRVRRLSRRMEQLNLDDAQANLFSELSLAVQDLNFILSEKFYPGHSGYTDQP
ncbi:MAG: YkgJ family cysteine cluster protein [Verrucomicrobia bacterium]|nr:YkgJ family cysteine cluster protein [Verrucomicrobiota bacterium]